MLPDVTGSWFFKMAATRPEDLRFQLADQIANRLPVTSGSILNSTIELLDPKMGLAVGTALPSGLETEI
jgi:hypothetical protein